MRLGWWRVLVFWPICSWLTGSVHSSVQWRTRRGAPRLRQSARFISHPVRFFWRMTERLSWILTTVEGWVMNQWSRLVQIGPKGALGLAWFHHLWMTEYDWTGLALCYMKLDSNTQTYLDTYSKLLESVGFLADQPLWDEGSVQCGTGWSYWAESWTPLDLIAIIY